MVVLTAAQLGSANNNTTTTTTKKPFYTFFAVLVASFHSQIDDMTQRRAYFDKEK
jgi:hypothetical protein